MAIDVTKQPQRLWPRWLIAGSKPVKVDLGPAGAGVLVDIGGGGIRVQSLAPLRRGAEVPVRLDIPDKYEPVQCSGIVVWSKPNGAAGIRFTTLSENQKTILRSWLEDLEQAATSGKDSQQQDEFTSIVSKIRAAQLNNADALNVILKRVSETTSASGSAIALGTPENMVCLAAVGIAPEVGTQIPPGMGLTSECVLRRKMVHCQNTKNDPRVGPNAKFGSAVILPLIVNGEVRGALEAFSPRAYAFDTTAIDTLEKLADAAVFVTYGIVTQRRLAAAKSPAPPPVNNISDAPKTAVAAQPSLTRPTVPAPTYSRSAASTETPVAAGAPYVKPAPPSPAMHQTNATAPASSAPIAQRSMSVESKPAASHTARASFSSATEASKVRPAIKSAPRLVEVSASRGPSSGKFVIIGLVVLLLAAVPLWFFVLRPKTGQVASALPVANQSAAAPVSQPIAKATVPQAQSVPAQATAVQAPPTPMAITSVARNTPVPAAKAEKVPASAEKESDPVARPPKPKPEPEPIVLSANTGRRPVQEDVDTPVAAPITITAGAMPTIALPVTSSAPKLAAGATSRRTGGELLKKVDPLYPQRAKSMNIQGQVELQVTVAPDGSVAAIRRLSGNSILANAAVEAVKHWRYDPVRLNGQAVESQTIVRLKFDLAR